MQIWWGFRFGMDALLFIAVYKFLATPQNFYRYGKNKPLKWLERRRNYVSNPYMIPKEKCQVKYDDSFNPIL